MDRDQFFNHYMIVYILSFISVDGYLAISNIWIILF